MNWKHFFEQQKSLEYFKRLQVFLANEESEGKLIFPSVEDRFKAFSRRA